MRSTCLAIVQFAKRSRFFFGILKFGCDIVVKKFTFAISSLDEFIVISCLEYSYAYWPSAYDSHHKLLVNRHGSC